MITMVLDKFNVDLETLEDCNYTNEYIYDKYENLNTNRKFTFNKSKSIDKLNNKSFTNFKKTPLIYLSNNVKEYSKDFPILVPVKEIKKTLKQTEKLNKA